jgi:hypothetical protein
MLTRIAAAGSDRPVDVQIKLALALLIGAWETAASSIARFVFVLRTLRSECTSIEIPTHICPTVTQRTTASVPIWAPGDPDGHRPASAAAPEPAAGRPRCRRELEGGTQHHRPGEATGPVVTTDMHVV